MHGAARCAHGGCSFNSQHAPGVTAQDSWAREPCCPRGRFASASVMPTDGPGQGPSERTLAAGPRQQGIHRPPHATLWNPTSNVNSTIGPAACQPSSAGSPAQSPRSERIRQSDQQCGTGRGHCSVTHWAAEIDAARPPPSYRAWQHHTIIVGSSPGRHRMRSHSCAIVPKSRTGHVRRSIHR